MKILVHSPAFLPLLGGLEINTAVLARGLVEMGDEVVVVTRTPGDGAESEPYPVVRDPAPRAFLRWTRWSDVVLHQNLSLRGSWPLLFVRRPLVVSHHSWYRRVSGKTGMRDRLKRAVVRRASGSIAVSPAIATELGAPTVVVENGYRDALFHPDSRTSRDRELLFVGRLVSDKGVDLLLQALALLEPLGLRPALTVVGDGPERMPLGRLAEELGLAARVTWTGLLQDEELATSYRRHAVLVVPSRYDEPYGIVALEGIACGCVVVGSQGGGLPNAIGPCGLTFPNGDVAGLAAALRRLLESPEERAQLRAGASVHLAAHGLRGMVAGYRSVLVKASGRGRGE